MELDFASKRLRSVCEDERRAQRQLGGVGARKLRARISDLRAAKTVSDLVVGNPHPLKRERDGQYSVRLDGGCRLVFVLFMEEVPVREDGSIAWEQVDSVSVVFIGDYHD